MAKEAFPPAGNFSGQTPVRESVCVCGVCARRACIFPSARSPAPGPWCFPVCLTGRLGDCTSVSLEWGGQHLQAARFLRPLPSPGGGSFSRVLLGSCSLGVLGSPPAQQLSGTEETAVKVREGSAGRGFTSAPVCQGLPPSQVERESGKHREMTLYISSLSPQTLEGY